ncbi:Branched-chain amino acid aminotransferase [Candidatus Johnevansia muelleri]|uniref:Branched-chain-amino-acid aminotransferase n=1 Tax=Candidatus Johnevansia muelleri TaxID=1495769 RepID=A0A078KHA8_9GAMM|nr:Branched-chain amino acid aminotransferase [Candidatus Evansia muelleri]
MKNQINWNSLGFSYIKTDWRYISYYKNNKWDDGKLIEDNKLYISEGSTALHYAQQCFEGLKAYRCRDGSINLFRPDQNAIRMQRSCSRLLMPKINCKKFIEACKQIVIANEHYIPPYGTRGALYLRPYIIGVGDNIGIRSAPEFIFSVFCVPVGSYFKSGLTPTNFIVSEYDRAATNGTGAFKVGGNYANSLLPGEKAKISNFGDCIYLDPKTHTKIEEVGSANFFAINYDNCFVTPKSPSILPSITKYSLLYIAKERLHLKVEECDIYINKLNYYKEAGACGTAAVITPIGGIKTGNIFHIFYSETEVGPITKRLYKELCGIQYGDIEAPKDWIIKVK